MVGFRESGWCCCKRKPKKCKMNERCRKGHHKKCGKGGRCRPGRDCSIKGNPGKFGFCCCTKKCPHGGKCKSNKDCEVNFSGYGGKCVSGKCKCRCPDNDQMPCKSPEHCGGAHCVAPWICRKSNTFNILEGEAQNWLLIKSQTKNELGLKFL